MPIETIQENTIGTREQYETQMQHLLVDTLFGGDMVDAVLAVDPQTYSFDKGDAEVMREAAASGCKILFEVLNEDQTVFKLLFRYPTSDEVNDGRVCHAIVLNREASRIVQEEIGKSAGDGSLPDASIEAIVKSIAGKQEKVSEIARPDAGEQELEGLALELQQKLKLVSRAEAVYLCILETMLPGVKILDSDLELSTKERIDVFEAAAKSQGINLDRKSIAIATGEIIGIRTGGSGSLRESVIRLADRIANIWEENIRNYGAKVEETRSLGEAVDLAKDIRETVVEVKVGLEGRTKGVRVVFGSVYGAKTNFDKLGEQGISILIWEKLLERNPELKHLARVSSEDISSLVFQLVVSADSGRQGVMSKEQSNKVYEAILDFILPGYILGDESEVAQEKRIKLKEQALAITGYKRDSSSSTVLSRCRSARSEGGIAAAVSDLAVLVDKRRKTNSEDAQLLFKPENVNDIPSAVRIAHELENDNSFEVEKQGLFQLLTQGKGVADQVWRKIDQLLGDYASVGDPLVNSISIEAAGEAISLAQRRGKADAEQTAKMVDKLEDTAVSQIASKISGSDTPGNITMTLSEKAKVYMNIGVFTPEFGRKLAAGIAAPLAGVFANGMNVGSTLLPQLGAALETLKSGGFDISATQERLLEIAVSRVKGRIEASLSLDLGRSFGEVSKYFDGLFREGVLDRDKQIEQFQMEVSKTIIEKLNQIIPTIQVPFSQDKYAILDVLPILTKDALADLQKILLPNLERSFREDLRRSNITLFDVTSIYNLLVRDNVVNGLMGELGESRARIREMILTRLRTIYFQSTNRQWTKASIERELKAMPLLFETAEIQDIIVDEFGG